MIDRQHGKIVIECDTCDVVFHSDSRDFSDAWERAKADGWSAAKTGDIWMHGCQTCGRPM